MSTAPARMLLRQIRKLTHVGRDCEASDGYWLQRFTACQDEAAFAALVRRHGPMVLGVSRRVLRDAHAAEDVFQAVFLVLAQRAKSIRKRAAVGSWLHGVAYRLAMKSRSGSARQKLTESQVRERQTDDPVAEASWREYLTILDKELDALPERFRVPLVLCYLEGQTRDEAARQTGWSLRTFDRRLSQGRELLRARLHGRGVTLGATLFTALLGQQAARADLPSPLMETALKAGLSHAGGSSATLSASAVALAKGMAAPIRWPTMTLVVVGVMALTWVGAVGYRLAGVGQPQTEAQQTRPGQQAGNRKANTVLPGDRLPDGALLRLGTLERRAVGAKLAMSADGKSIIGVRAGKYIHVWDAADGKLREKRELPVEDAWWKYWLSEDGRRLATADGQDGGISVWDMPTGKKVHRLTIKGGGYIMPAAFSADDKLVAAVANAQGQTVHFVHAWNLADGKEIFAKEIRVTAGSGVLAFSPDGKRLLAAFSSSEEGMHCWDIATGQQLWQQKEFVPSSLAFTPDGKILSPQDKYHVVDLATGGPVPMDKKPPLTWDTRPTLTPDGRTLLLSTPEGVIIWDLVNGKEIRTLKGAGEELLVARDGKSVITNNGALQRWDLATGRALWADNYEAGHVGEVTALVPSADGKRLASAAADGTVRLWDATTGRALHVWRGHEARRPVPLWRWMKAGVTALDMTPDGRWVLSAGSEAQLRLHDAATGKEVRSIALPARERGEDELRVFHLRITPDGAQAVALFGAEGFFFAVGPGAEPPPKHTYKLATWDLKTGKLAGWRAVEIQPARSSAIAPDGRTFLSGGVLSEVKTGQELAKLQGVMPGVNEPFTFSPDGTLIVGVVAEVTQKNGTTSSSPGGVRVWEAATGKTVARLKTKSWVGQVAIHPNNRYVITNDYDGVQLWDAVTGNVVAVRQMHERVHSSTTSGSYAGCLAFTPGGRLATGHPDSTVLVWDVPLPLPAAQPLTTRELENFWADLAHADADKAWQLIWRLSDGSAVPLLRERLRPVLPVPADNIRTLVADLEAESFERRQEAVKRLKEVGVRAAPALREALGADPTAEAKRRIQEVLAALEAPGPLSADAVRETRAVIALEHIGTREARDTLAALAKGVPEARMTREAKAALERMSKR